MISTLSFIVCFIVMVALAAFDSFLFCKIVERSIRGEVRP